MKPILATAVDGDLVARVAHAAAAANALPSIPVLGRAWRIDNPYSTVWCLRLQSGQWSQRFFVKQAKTGKVNIEQLREQLRREHDMLLRLAAVPPPGVAIGGAVQALAFFEDIPALATVAAEGPTLRQAYACDARRWSSAKSGQKLQLLTQQAGRWLASFQDRTRAPAAAFQADELIAYLEVRLKRLRARRPDAGMTAIVDALAPAVRSRAARLPPAGVAQCVRHNDFASHNMIVTTGDELRVLDFQACDTGPSVFDACNFWLELEFLKLDPSYRAELLAKLQHAFLEGYGRIRCDDPAFELARLRYTVNRLLNELDDPRLLLRWSWRWRRSVAHITVWLRHFGQGVPCSPVSPVNPPPP